MVFNINNEPVIKFPTCVVCGSKNIDIDGLCSADCRRKSRGDNKTCSCGAIWDGKEHGWYRPSFGSYSDISYSCPVCIKKDQEDYIHKNKRLKEIPGEIDELYKELEKYPEDYSPIYVDDDGEYRYSANESDISLNELIAEIENFKSDEKNITFNRNKRSEILKKIWHLNDEKNQCFVGSRYNPRSNT